MNDKWLATTQYRSWLEHAEILSDEGGYDIYAAYLMAYIGLILFCREEYNIPLGQEEIPIRAGQGLVRDYSSVYNNLPDDSDTKKFAFDAQSLLAEEPLTYYFGTEKRTMRYNANDFASTLYFLRNVRNNMVHGYKDFEFRNKVIVSIAYALMGALFRDVFKPDIQ